MANPGPATLCKTQRPRMRFASTDHTSTEWNGLLPSLEQKDGLATMRLCKIVLQAMLLLSALHREHCKSLICLFFDPHPPLTTSTWSVYKSHGCYECKTLLNQDLPQNAPREGGLARPAKFFENGCAVPTVTRRLQNTANPMVQPTCLGQSTYARAVPASSESRLLPLSAGQVTKFSPVA